MEYIIETNGLSKSFGSKKALDNVSIHIKKGDIYGFIGANGAGKTTLMKVVLGLLNPTSGSVKLFGEESNLDLNRRKIGSLIEAPGLYLNRTAYTNMKLFTSLFNGDESKINEILSFVGLDKVGNRKVGGFSLGMKQRLGIAIALIGDPEILVLDEPINGLDPEGILELRNLFLKLNKEKNITILISSHILGELSKIATMYGIISHGVLAEEISAEDLDSMSTESFEFEVDDSSKASEVIKKSNIDVEFAEKDGKIIVNNIEKSQEILKALVNSDVKVISFGARHNDIEKYFVERMDKNAKIN